MDRKSSAFLESLCNSFGPSGFEGESTRLLRDYVGKYCDDVSSDNLGSLLFTKRGTSDSPVVLLPAHIDEIGFIVSSIHELGFLTFNPLGGWFDQVLLGQRVKIRTSKGIVTGVIAAKPPHLISSGEESKLVRKGKMFIDIGASNEDEAKAMGVRIGNPVVPDSSYSTKVKEVFKDGKRHGSDTIAVGKAFDNRSSAFIVAEVVRTLKEAKVVHPNTVVGAATTQEEVGLRGARTSAYVVKPDVCLTIDVDLSGDVPGIEAKDAPAKMGLGPSILTFDETIVPNQGLLELVIDVAEKAKIPYQLSQTGEDQGGTDAGIIHMSNAGCPTLVIGVPTRHIHAHAGMMSLKDVENTTRLLVEVVKRLDNKTVKSFTAL